MELIKGRKKSEMEATAFIDLNELCVALGKTWPIQPGFHIRIDLLQRVRVRDGREVREFIDTRL